ncbi:MAG: hypothetical protein LBT90_01485 [Holosporaceae bacterium]|jgi:hypothetical protein|nr:hypothetical protein [Holosporaceae bacterium]
MEKIISIGTLSLIMFAYTENCSSSKLSENIRSNNRASNLLTPLTAPIVNNEQWISHRNLRSDRGDNNNRNRPQSPQQRRLNRIAMAGSHNGQPDNDQPDLVISSTSYDYMSAVNTLNNEHGWKQEYKQYKRAQRKKNPSLRTYFVNELRLRLGYRVPQLFQKNLPKMPEAVSKLIIRNTFYDQANIGRIANFFEIHKNILCFVPEYDSATALAGISALQALNINYDSMDNLLQELCTITPDLYLPKIEMNDTHHQLQLIFNKINEYSNESDIETPILLLFSNIDDAVKKYNKFKTTLERYILDRATRLYNKPNGGKWFSESVGNLAELVLLYESTKPSGAMSAVFDFFMHYFTFNNDGNVIRSPSISPHHFEYLVKQGPDSKIAPIPLKYQGSGSNILFDLNELLDRYKNTRTAEDSGFLRQFIRNYHRYLYNMRILQILPEARNYTEQIKYSTMVPYPIPIYEKLSDTNIARYLLSSEKLSQNARKLKLKESNEFFPEPNAVLPTMYQSEMEVFAVNRRRLLYEALSFVLAPVNVTFHRLPSRICPSQNETRNLIENSNTSTPAINALLDVIPEMQLYVKGARKAALEAFVYNGYMKFRPEEQTYFSDSAALLNLIFHESSDILEKRNNSRIEANDKDQYYIAKIFGHIIGGLQHCWIGMAESARLANDFIINTRKKKYSMLLCAYQAVRLLFYNFFQYIDGDGNPYIEATMCNQHVLYLNKGNFGLPYSLSLGYVNTAELANFLRKSPDGSIQKKLWNMLSAGDQASLSAANQTLLGNDNGDRIISNILLPRLFTPEHLIEAMVAAPTFLKAKESFLKSKNNTNAIFTNDSNSDVIEMMEKKGTNQQIAFDILKKIGAIVLH